MKRTQKLVRYLSFVFLSMHGFLGAGCVMRQPLRQVSGHAQILTAPKDLSIAQLERPDDPGIDSFVISPGFLLVGGWLWPDEPQKQQRETSRFSLELSLQWSPAELLEIPFAPTFPAWTLGLNLGFHAYDSKASRGLGALYLEGQFLLYGIGALALGYAWSPFEEAHGPQASMLLLGLFYLRGAYVFKRGWEFQMGICVKLPMLFSWKR